MKNKRVKVVLCILTMMLFGVACTSKDTPKEVIYGTGTRNIDYNIKDYKLRLKDVRFYDEENGKTYTDTKSFENGIYTILPGTERTKVITFMDKDGNPCTIEATVAFSTMPNNLYIIIDTKYNTEKYSKQK